jgi:hypothetical protein
METRKSRHRSPALASAISTAAIERIQRMHHGYSDTSAAILGYVELHFDARDNLRDRSPLNRDELDAARQQAIELASSGASRNARDEDAARLADDNRRAYHLAVTTYNKVRSVTQFLRYDSRDADDFAPPLGNKPYSKRAAKSAETVERTPSPTQPVGPAIEPPLEE